MFMKPVQPHQIYPFIIDYENLLVLLRLTKILLIIRKHSNHIQIVLYIVFIPNKLVKKRYRKFIRYEKLLTERNYIE